MYNLSWTPPLLAKDNSKHTLVYNTQVYVVTVLEEEEGEDEKAMLRGSVMLSFIGKIASCFAERYHM